MTSVGDDSAPLTTRAARWFDELLRREGSTRAVGLLRLGMACILWSEHGLHFRLHTDPTLDRIIVGVCFYLFSTAMLIGFRSRLACLLTGATLFVAYFHLGALGYSKWFVHNHSYAMANVTILLALTPCGRSYSLDRLLEVRRAERRGEPPPPERGPLWAIPLIALQVCMVYFWGGYSKLTPLFLSGGRMEQIFAHFYGSHEGVDFPGIKGISLVMAWFTILFEFVAPVGLWFRRTRKSLILLGVCFHASIYWMIPVSTFSAMTVLCYLAFVPTSTVERVTEQLHGRPKRAPG